MFTTAEDFFKTPYLIPNVDSEGSAFLSFVDEQEEKRLKKILGRELYDAFKAGLYETDEEGEFVLDEDENLIPLEEEVIEQQWKDLRDGNSYTYNDKVFYWDGMVELLKPYIYSEWIRYNAEKYNGSGGINIPSSENSTVASPAGLVVRGYNDFSRLCGNECEQENTLYGYLYNSDQIFIDDIGEDYDSITAYMSAKFCDPGKLNLFGF
jgi:hypothetical protein